VKKEKEIKDTPEVECGVDGDNNETFIDEIEALKRALEEKTKECDGYIDQLRRLAAEFDNFRKRTAREREAVYCDAVADTVEGVLPVLDNLERAIAVGNTEPAALKDGVELVLKQLKSTLCNIGVEEIEAVGETFDPAVHNAVMHEENEDEGQSVIVEEFQKGFKFKDKVIRHSMVKVVN